ncbi:MAG: fasciclin domain-containing protein [Pseudomonadota bacterium]|nr:fasciclin domain-containing protein [Pseudomonadota bacterium]
MSKVVLKISSWFVCLLTFAVISGCANPDVSVGAGEGGSLEGDPAEQVEELTLVQSIAANPNYSFFSDGLEYTQLNELLNDGAYEYTATVPTNAAFESLTDNQRETLLQNRGTFRNLLLRHITLGRVSSADLTANGATMLDGSDRLFPSGQFVETDVDATDGVLHGVNVVFSGPTTAPGEETILDVLSNDARFSGLVAAMSITDLSTTLDAAGNYTFFAPTNDAFVKLGVTRVRQLYSNLDELNSLLSHHTVPGASLSPQDFGDENGRIVPTLAADTLRLASIGGDLLVNNVPARIDSIATSNGIIYIIDTVLDDQ